MSILRTLTRAFAVVGKETLVIVRRPSALATLVLGPVIILAVFGLSYTGQPRIRAVLVIPASSQLPTDPSAYNLDASGMLRVIGTADSIDAARRQVRSGRADILVAAPADGAAQIKQGHQVTIKIEYDTINPYQDAVITRLAQPLAASVNEQIIQQAVAAGEAGGQASNLPPPSVIAAPTRAETTDLAPTKPRLVAFYGIAVLALILQHLGLTLGALSMTTDRRQGMTALLRVAPVRASELVIGKYLAFVVLVGLVGAALVGLMTWTFDVPMLASPGPVLLLFLLLIPASIGLGMTIALLTSSESQVIQLALLVLLASVFFGGLAIDLTQFARPLQIGAELLPVTQATRLGQDLFLRGGIGEVWRYGVLAAMVLVLSASAWLLLRRDLMLRR